MIHRCSLALLVLAVVGCTPSPDPAAWQESDVFLVASADERSELTGINGESRRVTQLTSLATDPSGVPVSVVLTGADAQPILWVQEGNEGAVSIRTIDTASGALTEATQHEPAVLPALLGGNLIWATLPSEEAPRLYLAGDVSDPDAFVEMPGRPSFIVAGPGDATVTAVVSLANGDEAVVTLDVATRTWTELPTGDDLFFGGLWASEQWLAVSVRAHAVEGKPDAFEPDNRLLVWRRSDPGAFVLPDNPAPTPTIIEVGVSPTVVSGSGDRLLVAVGTFEEPAIEIVAFPGSPPPVSPGPWRVASRERVVAIWTDGSTGVASQDRHVTFIDLQTGSSSAIELPGETATTWQIATDAR